MLTQRNTKKSGGQSAAGTGITKYTSRSGSIAVEAAIFIPLFIIGILTLGYLLKFCMISEGVHHSLADEAHRVMADPGTMYVPAVNEQRITGRIDSESRGEARGIQTRVLPIHSIGVSKGGSVFTHIIAMSATFDTPLKLPRLFLNEVQGERTVLCRAFVGKTHKGPVKPFDEMEKNDGGTMVWVFPRAGERYHGERCSYIANNPREVLLNSYIRSRYSPCKLCKPAGRKDGTLVYCFETSGKAYHTGECTIVDRYVIEKSKEDAEKQGYTPCSRCGGG